MERSRAIKMERAERKSERDEDRESRRESVRESEIDIFSFKRCFIEASDKISGR